MPKQGVPVPSSSGHDPLQKKGDLDEVTASGKRENLRGLSYDEQVAQLAPSVQSSGAPVQMEKTEGDATTTPPPKDDAPKKPGLNASVKVGGGVSGSAYQSEDGKTKAGTVSVGTTLSAGTKGASKTSTASAELASHEMDLGKDTSLTAHVGSVKAQVTTDKDGVHPKLEASALSADFETKAQISENVSAQLQATVSALKLQIDEKKASLRLVDATGSAGLAFEGETLKVNVKINGSVYAGIDVPTLQALKNPRAAVSSLLETLPKSAKDLVHADLDGLEFEVCGVNSAGKFKRLGSFTVDKDLNVNTSMDGAAIVETGSVMWKNHQAKKAREAAASEQRVAQRRAEKEAKVTALADLRGALLEAKASGRQLNRHEREILAQIANYDSATKHGLVGGSADYLLDKTLERIDKIQKRMPAPKAPKAGPEADDDKGGAALAVGTTPDDAKDDADKAKAGDGKKGDDDDDQDGAKKSDQKKDDDDDQDGDKKGGGGPPKDDDSGGGPPPSGGQDDGPSLLSRLTASAGAVAQSIREHTNVRVNTQVPAIKKEVSGETKKGALYDNSKGTDAVDLTRGSVHAATASGKASASAGASLDEGLYAEASSSIKATLGAVNYAPLMWKVPMDFLGEKVEITVSLDVSAYGLGAEASGRLGAALGRHNPNGQDPQLDKVLVDSKLELGSGGIVDKAVKSTDVGAEASGSAFLGAKIEATLGSKVGWDKKAKDAYAGKLGGGLVANIPIFGSLLKTLSADKATEMVLSYLLPWGDPGMIDLFGVAATGTGTAGIGASGKAVARMSGGKIRVGFGGSWSLGLGGGFGIEVFVDAVEGARFALVEGNQLMTLLNGEISRRANDLRSQNWYVDQALSLPSTLYRNASSAASFVTSKVYEWFSPPARGQMAEALAESNKESEAKEVLAFSERRGELNHVFSPSLAAALRPFAARDPSWQRFYGPYYAMMNPGAMMAGTFVVAALWNQTNQKIQADYDAVLKKHGVAQGTSVAALKDNWGFWKAASSDDVKRVIEAMKWIEKPSMNQPQIDAYFLWIAQQFYRGPMGNRGVIEGKFKAAGIDLDKVLADSQKTSEQRLEEVD